MGLPLRDCCPFPISEINPRAPTPTTAGAQGVPSIPKWGIPQLQGFGIKKRDKLENCPKEAPFPVNTTKHPRAQDLGVLGWCSQLREGLAQAAPATALRELDQLSHFSRMRHGWCCSQIHLPLLFLPWICISPLGSSFPAQKGLCWGLLPPRAPFRFPPPRAPCGVPPSFPSNCYVKIPRTCFCKELKEGEEGIVFVSVSPSL